MVSAGSSVDGFEHASSAEPAMVQVDGGIGALRHSCCRTRLCPGATSRGLAHEVPVSAASGPTEDLQQMRRRGAIERSVVCERFFAALIVRSWVQ